MVLLVPTVHDVGSRPLISTLFCAATERQRSNPMVIKDSKMSAFDYMYRYKIYMHFSNGDPDALAKEQQERIGIY